MIEKKNTYLSAKNSLDQIIEQVRAKDLPLEKALDLYEEAIRIGNSCADLIDRADFSLEEIETLNLAKDATADSDKEDVADSGSGEQNNSDEGEDTQEQSIVDEAKSGVDDETSGDEDKSHEELEDGSSKDTQSGGVSPENSTQ